MKVALLDFNGCFLANCILQFTIFGAWKRRDWVGRSSGWYCRTDLPCLRALLTTSIYRWRSGGPKEFQEAFQLSSFLTLYWLDQHQFLFFYSRAGYRYQIYSSYWDAFICSINVLITIAPSLPHTVPFVFTKSSQGLPSSQEAKCSSDQFSFRRRLYLILDRECCLI